MITDHCTAFTVFRKAKGVNYTPYEVNHKYTLQDLLYYDQILQILGIWYGRELPDYGAIIVR